MDARKPVRSFEVCLLEGLRGHRSKLNRDARKPVRSFEAGREWFWGKLPVSCANISSLPLPLSQTDRRSYSLDGVTVTHYYDAKENANMEKGNIVKFIDGLYPDEKGAKYKVLEINGDRAVIEFICELPIPPQSIAKISELEVVLQ
jgi:hypothetical protein